MGNNALDARRANIDVVLTNLSIGIPTDQDFIGDKLLPPLVQPLSVARIPVWGTEAFRIREDKIGDFSEPEKLDISVDTTLVEVDGHGLIGLVSDRQQIEAERGPLSYNLEAEVLQTVVSSMDLAREKLQADLVCSQAIYTGTNAKIDLNGTSAKWDDSNVDPTDNLITAIESTIPNASGKRPNVLWMGQEVWAALIQNPKLKNRLFGSLAGQPIPNAAQVASLLGLQSVLVGRAVSKVYSSSAVGGAGANTKLWGKNAGVLYVPPTAGRRIPAFGYTVEQSVFGAASEQVIRIRNEKMGASGGEEIKRSTFYTPTSLFPNAGVLFYNAVT
jgi:hypothetical protein